MNILDKNTSITGNTPLPPPGNSRVHYIKQGFNDDLSGVTFMWLMTHTMILKKIPKRKPQLRGEEKFVRPTPNYNSYQGSKPYTYLFNKFCVRGPYTKTTGGTDSYPQKVYNIINRSTVFNMLPQSNVMTPIGMIQDKDMFFVIFDNIYKDIRLEYILFTDAKTGYQYNIVKPNTIVTLEEALISNKNMTNINPSVLRDLIILYGMKAGGITSDNTLVGTDRVYIINIEGDSTSDAHEDFRVNNRLFYFSKIGNVASGSWLNTVQTYYMEVSTTLEKWIEPLRSAGLTQEMLDRILIGATIIKDLVFKQGQDLTMTMSVLAPVTIPGVYRYSDQMVETQIVDEPVSVSRTQKRSIAQSFTMRAQKMEMEGMLTTPPPKIATPYYSEIWRDTAIQQPIHTEVIDFGAMVVGVQPSPVRYREEITSITDKIYGQRGGMFAADDAKPGTITTYSAAFNSLNIGQFTARALYTLSTMAAALKYYIRLGDLDKSLMTMTEIWRLHEIGYRNSITILFNTLSDCVLSLVGAANTNMVYTTLFYCDNWIQQLRSNNSKPVDDIIDFHMLCYLVREIVLSPKTSLTVYMPTVYVKGSSYSQSIIKEENAVDAYTALTSKYQAMKFIKQSDDERVKILVTLFYSYMKNRDPNALVWLNLIIVESGTGLRMTRRGANTIPIYLLFDIFTDLFGKDAKYIEPYSHFYSRTKNTIVFYFMATSYIAFKDLGELKAIPQEEASKIPVEILLEGRYQFNVDLQAIHTALEKKIFPAETVLQFRADERNIVNEDKSLIIPWIYEIYGRIM